jgi:alginate O-acetyltransferase complex protein AlgI
MLFNSYPFIFGFLPIVLCVFFLAGKKSPRLAIAWLVIASLFFYGYWDPQYLWVIATTMLFNYAAALFLINPRWRDGQKKVFLIVCIVANLLRLGYFKYMNFFVDNINAFAGTNYHLDLIVLPLGISFFTFVEIAYLVDAYRGDVGNYNFLDYCLFITFFPHLLAGPIVHHKELLPQFAKPSVYRFNPVTMAVGLTTFTIGLFKKTVVADAIAVYANAAFGAATSGVQLTFLESWGGAIAYTLQLYFDFSGYSDMAIGLGLMFGIRWPLNFYSPFKAVNIIELWRRWHMTLSRFLRDYLYFALGGNRKGPIRRYTNLLLTMIIGGFWHGAGWTFVLWGTLHGVYLVINHAWHAFRQNVLGQDLRHSTWWGREVGRVMTFAAWVIGLVLFRSNNMDTALGILGSMVGRNGVPFLSPTLATPLSSAPSHLIAREIGTHAIFSPLVFGDPFWGIVWVIGALLAVRFLPNTHEIMRRFETTCDDYRDPLVSTPEWLRWQPTLPWAIACGAGFLLAVYQLEENTEFIYFQF